MQQGHPDTVSATNEPHSSQTASTLPSWKGKDASSRLTTLNTCSTPPPLPRLLSQVSSVELERAVQQCLPCPAAWPIAPHFSHTSSLPAPPLPPLLTQISSVELERAVQQGLPDIVAEAAAIGLPTPGGCECGVVNSVNAVWTSMHDAAWVSSRWPALSLTLTRLVG